MIILIDLIGNVAFMGHSWPAKGDGRKETFLWLQTGLDP